MKINLNENYQINADAIMKDVLKHIDDIFSIKGLEIYFGEYITESFEAHMKSENSIVVTYLGKDIIVPLRENIRKLSRDLLARYVMQGFAKLYLNKTESKDMNKKNTIRLTESELKNIITESVKRILRENNTINEISSDLLFRAAEKAGRDMHRNWNDSEIRTKRDKQEDRFFKAAIEKDRKERNSICPRVPESELKNMPKGTYVVMDGTGRDYYGSFTSHYSGYAGTKEQCEAYITKYYDKDANWEYLPSILPLETYLKNHIR